MTPLRSSNGQALVQRLAEVADRAQHHAALDRLALAGVAGADRAVLLDQLVAADHDPLDPAVALDLDRRAEEAQHDPLLLALWLGRWENSVKISTLRRLVGSQSSDST